MRCLPRPNQALTCRTYIRHAFVLAPFSPQRCRMTTSAATMTNTDHGATPARSTYDAARSQIEGVARYLRLEEDILRLLSQPFRELRVEVPVRMDDGHLE